MKDISPRKNLTTKIWYIYCDPCPQFLIPLMIKPQNKAMFIKDILHTI